MKDTFIIHGGKPLHGEIEIQGSKNSALALLAASLVSSKKCHFKNIPEIEDVKKMLLIIKSLGVNVSDLTNNEVTVHADKISTKKIDCDAIGDIRASIQIIGPLVSRASTFSIVAPGGCKIGSRPLDAHLSALKAIGSDITIHEDVFTITKPTLLPDSVTMTHFSPTATINVLLAAARERKKMTIYCAAEDYFVQEVCWFLEKLGLTIHGIGTHTLTIEGGLKEKDITYEVIPDPIEVGTLLCLAGATRSELVIKNAPIDFLRMELELIKKIGVQFKFIKIGKNKSMRYTLSDIATKPTKHLSAVSRIHNMPAPGIMPDLLPPLSVLLTQANGTSLIHDWMYDGRLSYIKELEKMGASAHILNPHQALVVGPTPLYGKQITSFDLRAGATLIIAALTAKGESEIKNIYQVDRGYEKFDKRLALLGADIKRA